MSQNKDKGTFERMGETVGGFAGQAAGRATDTVMNLAGSVFGPAAQQLGDWFTGPDANRAASTFDADRDRACRQHYTSRASTGSGSTGASGGTRAGGYESTRPLYQFGHLAGQNPDYQGRSFREVEPELERAWSQGMGERHGRWSEVRDYVGFGYDPGINHTDL
jgi:hypothetical protein